MSPGTIADVSPWILTDIFKCSRGTPCDTCLKAGYSCRYIPESFEIPDQTLLADNSHNERPEDLILESSKQENRTAKDNHKEAPVSEPIAVVEEVEAGRKYALGASSWTAEVPLNKELSGIKHTLEKFSEMRRQNELDCTRPSDKIVEKGTEASMSAIKNHTDAYNPSLEKFGTINAILGHSSAEFSDYLDPTVNGFDQFLLRNLLDTYYLAVHPFNNILNWTKFRQEVFGSNDNSPSTALLESSVAHMSAKPSAHKISPTLAAIIWISLASAARVLPADHDIIITIKRKLEAGKLNPLHSEFVQQDPRFIAEPSEYFLVMGERCLGASNILTSVDDVGSIKALLLYITALHDGSTRTWCAWSLMGIVTSLVQSLGWDRPLPSTIDQNDIAREKTHLFIKVCNVGQSLALDLGQYFSPFPKIRYIQKYATVTATTLNDHFEFSKYCLSRITRQILDLIYFDYGGINSEEVENSSLLEHSFVKLWSSIPEDLRLRSNGYSGPCREHVEDADVTIEFQRIILDTLLHFSRFIYYRPSLKSSTNQNSVRQGIALHSARSLLENQLKVSQDNRLLIFRHNFWKEIYCHVFQAAVVIALLLRNDDFIKKGPEEFQQVFYPLIDQSVELYYNARAHTLCSSAKAHAVLSYILGRESKVRAIRSTAESAEPAQKPETSPTASFSTLVTDASDTFDPIREDLAPRHSSMKSFSVKDRECQFHGWPDLAHDVFELDFFAGILGEESNHL